MTDPFWPNPELDLPPVESYFVVQSIPAGEAPDEVREQWVDLALPLRYKRPIEGPHRMPTTEIISKREDMAEDGVRIYTVDCVDALKKASKHLAAEYWAQRRGRTLIFNASEGMLISVDAKNRFYPDLE